MAGTLALFRPYPLSDRPISEQERRLHEASKSFMPDVKPLRVQKTIYTPFELVLDCVANNSSAFSWQVEERFKTWRNTAKQLGQAPPYKLIPHHRVYQSTAKIHPDMGKEAEDVGVLFPSGQYLFHGGEWPGPIEAFDTDGVFSVSFSPAPAVWHARCNRIAMWSMEKGTKPEDSQHPTVWILCVSSICTSKAVLYHKKGAGMGEEMEAVFSAGIRVQPWRVSHHYGIKIVEAFVHSANRINE